MKRSIDGISGVTRLVLRDRSDRLSSAALYHERGLVEIDPILSRQKRPLHNPRPILFLAFLFGAFGSILVAGTGALFRTDDIVNANRVGVGAWIPELEIMVAPEEPDGEHGTYEHPPCITLTASLPDTTLYYEFSSDGDPVEGGSVYGGGCLPFPSSREVTLQTQAVRDENHDWKSGVVTREFQIMSDEDEEQDGEDREKHKKGRRHRDDHHDREHEPDEEGHELVGNRHEEEPPSDEEGIGDVTGDRQADGWPEGGSSEEPVSEVLSDDIAPVTIDPPSESTDEDLEIPNVETIPLIDVNDANPTNPDLDTGT